MQHETTPAPQEYYTQRELNPRTGDVAAFTGRTSGADISPRSDYHENLLTPRTLPGQLDAQQDLQAEAGFELEGYTNDGGLALNVGFDQTEPPQSSPRQIHRDQPVPQPQSPPSSCPTYHGQARQVVQPDSTFLCLPLFSTLAPTTAGSLFNSPSNAIAQQNAMFDFPAESC